MFLKHLSKITAFLLFITAIVLPVAAQVEQVQIVNISVEGNQYADPGSIIALSGLRVGDMISVAGDTKIQNAIKNLWKRKQFSDVNIIVDKITSAGVFLVIKVKEASRLSDIRVENNKELSKEEIKKGIGKVRGDILSGYDLYLAKKKIKKLYSEEGLMFAKVESELIPTDTALYTKLILDIQEGVEFHVNSIDFEGNKTFSDGDLAGAFKETHTKSWWEFWRSSKFDLKEYETDLDNLREFFKKKGFIDAQIIKDTVLYNDNTGTVDIKVTVDEGNKVFIRKINFTGNVVYPNDWLLRRLDFEPGDVYDAEQFDKNLQGNEEQSDVSSLYLDNGFLAKRIEKEELRVAPDSVDLTIRIFEGDRVTIRRIDVVGNSKTKDKVIRRELFTRPGDYFNKSAVIRSVRALGVMQYFNPENLRPEVKPVPTDNTKVDLVYNVDERSTDTFNASVGFAGIYGLTGSIGMTFNNFSISEPLRGGGGQVLNFAWEFGYSNLRRFTLGFTEPWLFDEPTTVGFNLYDSRVSYFYNIRQTGLSINVGRRFSFPDDYFRGDWFIRYQQNDVGSQSATYYRPGLNTEISLGQTFSRISLNSMFFPTTGSKFSFSTQYAMGALGIGTTDYLKNELNFEIYNPLMKVGENDRLVLYVGSRLGYITGIKSDTTISPIELYYMGGNGLSGYSVTPLRGYDDRAIGPRDGGKVLARHVAELRFALSVDPMPIYVYAFAEAGNVWSNLRLTDPFELKRSVGLGIQLMIMPIGILGFSYGYGIDPDYTGNVSGWRFLFHLGNN